MDEIASLKKKAEVAEAQRAAFFDTLTQTVIQRDALREQVERFRQTNRRLNRRVQLLEGWWARKVERSKNWMLMWQRLYFRDIKQGATDIKAIEEAAYQRGFEDGHDLKFIIPARRAKARAAAQAQKGGE